MNILLLCDEYPPGRHGGIGTAVQLLAREFVRQGHTVVAAGLYDWGYGGEDHFTDEGVQVYRFRYGLSGRWLQKRDALRVRIAYRLLRASKLLQADIQRSLKRYALHLEKLIAQYNIDIVEMPEFQEFMPYVSRYTPFPKLSVPVVVKLHGSVTHIRSEGGLPVRDCIQASEMYILNQATAVSSVSAYAAQQAAKRFQYQRPIEVLYNGIDLSAIPKPSGNVKRAGLVIYTGALVSFKGVPSLLSAWNKVHDAMPDAQLELYGKGAVSALKALLTAEAAATVHFKGHIPRTALLQTIGSAAAAVFPSYTESFALAPMEAMASGTATIFTTRASGPELIKDGVNGLLADPDDTEELAKKIVFLLQQPEEAERLAAAGRTTIETQFSINHIAQQNAAFYERVLDDARAQ